MGPFNTEVGELIIMASKHLKQQCGILPVSLTRKFTISITFVG